jgi:hypothetical protein
MASGRAKGAKAIQERAKTWRQYAAEAARSAWNSTTEARFWTVDEMAKFLVSRINNQFDLTVSASTVVKAISGVKRSLRDDR